MTFDPSSGRMTETALSVEAEDPTWLCIHPNSRFLCAVNELTKFQGKDVGALSSFAIDRARARLMPINQVPSGGMNPSYLDFDPTGKWLFFVNYGGDIKEAGSTGVFAIQDDGNISPQPSSLVVHTGHSVLPRQQAAHPHSMALSSDRRYLFVPDKGADRIVQYLWDRKTGGLSPNETPYLTTPAATGPRHITFSRNKRFVFVNGELNGTVAMYECSSLNGTLTHKQTLSTLPTNFSGQNLTSEVALHPSGRFLYVANRGADTIAMFSVDDLRGTLQLVGHVSSGGKTPRNIKIHPDGRFMLVANQHSDSVVCFSIDPLTGNLLPAGNQVSIASPTCIVFMP